MIDLGRVVVISDQEPDLNNWMQQICDSPCGTLAGGLIVHEVAGMEDLTRFPALAKLKRLRGPLIISETKSLRSLRGLEGIESTTRIGITENDGLESLDGLAVSQDITGVDITINPNLVNIDAIASIAKVGSLGVWIRGNGALLSTPDLKRLALEEGELVIRDNSRLTDVKGASSLTRARSVRIVNNPELASIGGFESLVEVTDSLEVYDNPKLRVCDIERAFGGATAMERHIDGDATCSP